MAKHTEVEPVALHPVLKASLGCMDVQIEDELARYRRRRAEERAPVATAPAPVPAQPASPAPAAIASDTNDIADLTRPAPTREATATPEAAASPPPEDDLESSKQLRRNLPAPETATPATPTLLDRLLTPMGVGSLLLLGVATTLLGSALLAPETLNEVAGGWLSADEADPSASESPAGAGGLDLEGPNLADDEFDPLDLDSLSTVETDPDAPEPPPSPAASPLDEGPRIRAEDVPEAELPGRESDLTTALLSPEVEGAAEDAEAAPSPSPSPSPDLENDPAVANAVAGPAAGDRFYYVVASYGGPDSLNRARNTVPEAYLRRFPQGVQIQMGAFASEGDAQALIDRLEQQGIAASVFQR